MMQTAQSRHRDDYAIRAGVRFSPTSAGRLLRQPKVSPIIVVVIDVLVHQAFEMALIEDDHVVEQIAAATADEALGNTILPRALKAGSLGLDAEVLDGVDHFIIEIRATVEDQMARCGIQVLRLRGAWNRAASLRMTAVVWGRAAGDAGPSASRRMEPRRGAEDDGCWWF